MQSKHHLSRQTPKPYESEALRLERLSASLSDKEYSGKSCSIKSFSDKYYNNKWRLARNIAGLLLVQGVILLPAQAASTARTGQQVLMIEMTPALCNLQPSRARMRQCLEGYSLTVSGLDLGYGERCGRGSDPRLTPLQLKVVNRIMPDTTVRTQAWQHYGACSPLSSSSYFRQIVNHAGQLKLPNELNTGNSYTVSKSRFIGQMTRLNKGMTASSIDLICQDGSRRQSVLTDVHVCYEGNQFGRCNSVINNCGKNFIISSGR
ncbi:hypothetical protein [Psychrobacter urativorans]|nr:hypothetical protein [Psychrobacter urativorans]